LRCISSTTIAKLEGSSSAAMTVATPNSAAALA